MVVSIPKYTSTIVGALACQKDSYLKTLTTKVVNCQKYFEEELSKDKKSKKNQSSLAAEEKYAVELEDTILFPLGGGQPFDLGTISYVNEQKAVKQVPVFSVIRDGLIARHITKEPISIGTEVELEVDWKRRFDHMQQHTGQHLLSAILDKYELNTLSWAMTEMINYIEIPRKLSEEEVEKVSEEVNDAIMQNIGVNVEIPHKDLVDKSKMPDDYDIDKGVLRVVHIADLDSNPCCGTHLSSTGQIGTITLLHQAPVRGSNSRLFFIAGDRTRKYLRNTHEILKTLNSSLSCQTEEIVEKVELMGNNLQKANKKEQNLLKELSAYKVKEIQSDFEKGDFTYLYKPDAKMEFILQISKDLMAFFKENSSAKTLVLMCGEGKDGGSLIVVGQHADVVGASLKKLITNMKGGGKGKFQGKITSFEKGEDKSVIDYLESVKNADELSLERLSI